MSRIARYFVLLLIFLNVNIGEGSDSCKQIKTTYTKLMNYLLCNYDSSIRPVKNHLDVTPVSLRLILKYFSYDVALGVLTLESWLRIQWTDEFLTWNPDDYEKLDAVYMDTFHIWKPDISVYNRAVQSGDPTLLGDTKCTISSNGTVICVASVHMDILCLPNLEMYPFDTQTCELRMGSWVHKGEEIDLRITKDVVYQKTLEPGGEWEIINYTPSKYRGNYSCCPKSTYPSVGITFDIKRLHAAHAASVIIPSVVIVLLTFTALASSSVNKERLDLCYVNVICQFMHVQYMSWLLPLKGENTPLLLLFARDSLLMAVILIVFTIIFKHLAERKSPAPFWISSIVSIAISFPLGQYIFIGDNSLKGIAYAKGDEDGANIINPEKHKPSDWEILVKILDFLLLVVYVISYFIITLRFIP